MDTKKVSGTKKASCCSSTCCQVEALISVDERGQMVLPKTLRQKMGIKSGDKLSLVSLNCGEKVCCLALVKAEDMSEMAGKFLGPVLKDLKGGKE
jgi:AbrB family looped-hinge helix DNA binding protein